MTTKKSVAGKISAEELQFIELLREHPHLMQRFRNILEISSNAEGPVKSADEVEGLVIEEMRRLGNATMGDWAASVEKRLGEELQQKEASARVRKKKR